MERWQGRNSCLRGRPKIIRHAGRRGCSRATERAFKPGGARRARPTDQTRRESGGVPVEASRGTATSGRRRRGATPPTWANMIGSFGAHRPRAARRRLGPGARDGLPSVQEVLKALRRDGRVMRRDGPLGGARRARLPPPPPPKPNATGVAPPFGAWSRPAAAPAAAGPRRAPPGRKDRSMVSWTFSTDPLNLAGRPAAGLQIGAGALRGA